MARFFCSIRDPMTDRRMTLAVDAMDHAQAKHRGQAIFESYYPRKVGERRSLDVQAMNMNRQPAQQLDMV